MHARHLLLKVRGQDACAVSPDQPGDSDFVDARPDAKEQRAIGIALSAPGRDEPTLELRLLPAELLELTRLCRLDKMSGKEREDLELYGVSELEERAEELAG